jgi:hypothetical protein
MLYATAGLKRSIRDAYDTAVQSWAADTFGGRTVARVSSFGDALDPADWPAYRAGRSVEWSLYPASGSREVARTLGDAFVPLDRLVLVYPGAYVLAAGPRNHPTKRSIRLDLDIF